MRIHKVIIAILLLSASARSFAVSKADQTALVDCFKNPTVGEDYGTRLRKCWKKDWPLWARKFQKMMEEMEASKGTNNLIFKNCQGLTTFQQIQELSDTAKDIVRQIDLKRQTQKVKDSYCSKKRIDSEYNAVIKAYKKFASGISGFKGCLDLTQSVAGVFGRVKVNKERVRCWKRSIAWRLTVVSNKIMCLTNFMHNAFAMDPVNKKFGHRAMVLDPYTIMGFSHPAKIQSIGKFVKEGGHGGLEVGATNVSRKRERERSQETINRNSTQDWCEEAFNCLNKEYKDDKTLPDGKRALKNTCE